MKSFLKALRYCWPYRYRLLLAWGCGIVAAALWVGSITAVLPLFKLLFDQPPEGVRLVQKNSATDPGVRVWTLEVSPSWQVEPDASVETFEVRGTRVRVRPDLAVVRPEGGLMGFARQAQEEGKFYAPVAVYLAARMPRDRFSCLAWIMGVVMLMAVLRGALTYSTDYLVGHATNRAMLSLRLRVFEHVLRSPLSLYSRIGATDIMSRFQQDCFLVLEGMKTVLGKVVVEPPRAILCLVLAVVLGVSIDPWLPIIVLVAAPLVGYLVRKFAILMRRASRKTLESSAQLMGILEESLFGIRVVKGYRLEAHQRRRFFAASRRLLKQILRAIRVDAITNPTVDVLFTVAASLAAILGGKIIIDRGVDTGDVMLFFGLLIGSLDPVRKLSNVSNRFQQGASGSDRLWQLFEADAEPRYGTTGKPLARLARDIEFRGVSFEYVPGVPVLQDIDLTVRHGEVVAIIGRTGCGKTTLVNLVPRFFEPTTGSILIDGTDTRDITLRSLRDQIAYVPQETILFADTVAGNIGLGAAQAGRQPPARDRIEGAARAAHADLFIRDMPEGYETLVGEHGTTLSGGERQRVALARAILRDPAILILDEATSALDEETQALVQGTLSEFVAGRTTLLIAHRLSTLTIAHRIVVMDAGRILAAGTHEQLLQTCAAYRRLRDVGLDGV
ncbi:MAG TPA: ABC transporter ATP-binding protein [Phycisphaerae bacterium]|nr:ABC transporter ATP-binding protein [Phycisphaerae bacterium]